MHIYRKLLSIYESLITPLFVRNTSKQSHVEQNHVFGSTREKLRLRILDTITQ